MTELGKINEIKVDGDNNIVIQDVNGSTITININNDNDVKDFLASNSNKLIEIESFIKEKFSSIFKFQNVVQNAKNIGNQYGNQNTQNFS